MNLVKSLLGLLLAALFLGDSLQFGNMGPYDIVVEQVLDCEPDANSLLKFELGVYFVKEHGVRKQMFKGNASTAVSKEDFYNLEVHNKYYMMKNKNWLLMLTYDGNLCTTIDEFTKQPYNEFLEKLGLEKDECAIEPGNYTLTDWSPFVSFPAPMLEYGPYKIVLHVMLGKVTWACIELVGNVNPKS